MQVRWKGAQYLENRSNSWRINLLMKVWMDLTIRLMHWVIKCCDFKTSVLEFSFFQRCWNPVRHQWHLSPAASVWTPEYCVYFDIRLVHCFSFNAQTAAEDSDVRTEPCNRPADINPMCLTRPGHVGLRPARERRGSDDSACLCQVQQVHHKVRHTYLPPLCLSLCLSAFVCLSIYVTPTHTHILYANTDINIWGD